MEHPVSFRKGAAGQLWLCPTPLPFLARRLLFDDDWWPRFVPVGTLFVSVRDLQDARFIQRFAEQL